MIKIYTTINSGFEKRVKEENREYDEWNMNEKRAQKSPKQKAYQKRRRDGRSKINLTLKSRDSRKKIY